MRCCARVRVLAIRIGIVCGDIGDLLGSEIYIGRADPALAFVIETYFKPGNIAACARCMGEYFDLVTCIQGIGLKFACIIGARSGADIQVALVDGAAGYGFSAVGINSRKPGG